MNIFIVGSGKLAKALLSSTMTVPGGNFISWDAEHPALAHEELPASPQAGHPSCTEKAIVVHAGSGRQLRECCAFCSRTKSVFIELSTGLETETMTPDFPLVICPNTSVLVLKILRMLQAHGGTFAPYDISLTESHQSSKKSAPGTALALAESLGLAPAEMVSVRDPEVQLQDIGIPEEYLNRHAWHKMVIKDGTDEVTITTKVLGHESYARGVQAIVDAVMRHPLQNRRYHILDIIDSNIL